MEIKKTPKANLENKKMLFREIGLVIVLILVILAFEWKSREKSVSDLVTNTAASYEEEMIPITKEQQPEPQEQPKVEVLIDKIEILNNDIKIDNDLKISDEDTKDLAVDLKPYTKGTTTLTDKTAEEEAIPVAVVEEKPKFQGGDETTFLAWVGSHTNYPELARENGISGKVFVEFVVMTDGSVKNVKVIRGINSELDKEAVRVISSSPKWSPGRQRDKPVKVKYHLPVSFILK